MTGLLRLITLRPCREPFCKERIRCWRWHVEVFTCPTCKREVNEFDPQFGAVLDAVMVRGPVLISKPPKTWTTGVVHNSSDDRPEQYPSGTTATTGLGSSVDDDGEPKPTRPSPITPSRY